MLGGRNASIMLGNRKLVLDTFCEVYDLLRPWADAEFWNLDQHHIVPGAVYLIGRAQFTQHIDLIKNLVSQKVIQVILSNPAEGSETLARHCAMYGIEPWVKSGTILLIGGGDMDPAWPCLQYDSFLPKILDYEENLQAIDEYKKQQGLVRPYKLLFLNGRNRPHRKYLLSRLHGLLDQCIWTNLDSAAGPLKILDKKYEFDHFADTVIDNHGFVKYQRFGGLWGEIYLKAQPYLDTYFSLVTETVYDYPYSFRTEKIWKPIAMGHPWIAVANRGFYRDMHNMGFRTFGQVIDESFDLIDNNQDRLQRTAVIVEDLCNQDLAAFLEDCDNVCKYNQQHLADMRVKVRHEFPKRFKQFIKKHYFHE